MSEFEVNIVKVDDIIDHPNADKLTIVKIGGYNCIANKKDDGTWRYAKGDYVVYVPEGAVLPEYLLKRMGFWNEEKGKGFLTGSKGNRVKAIKLRGVVSQGVLIPTYKNMVRDGSGNYKGIIVDGKPKAPVTVTNQDTGEDVVIQSKTPESKVFNEGDDVAEFLGIVKWEPEIPVQMRGQITGGLFGYTKSYDIENAQKYNNAFEVGEDIVATEKLHGTLCQIGFLNDAPETIKHELFEVTDHIHAYVTSKGLAKKGIIQKNTEDNENNLYVAAYNKYIKPKAEEIVARFMQLNNLDGFPDKTWRLYIFGEIFGSNVQDLNYGITEPDFNVFDVYVKIMDADGKIEKEGYLNQLELINWCSALRIKKVPNIFTGKFESLEALEQYRDGQTTLGNGHIREGIVIKPTKEREYTGLPDNRLQLKYVSPDYLLRKGGTEFN